MVGAEIEQGSCCLRLVIARRKVQHRIPNLKGGQESPRQQNASLCGFAEVQILAQFG